MSKHLFFLPLRLALAPVAFLFWLGTLPLIGWCLKVWAAIILLAALVLLKVGTAFAMPAGKLHETCTSEIDRDYSFGFCSGYSDYFRCAVFPIISDGEGVGFKFQPVVSPVRPGNARWEGGGFTDRPGRGDTRPVLHPSPT